ncbi:olfactory receptor 1-like [Gopherus evgoodei]|uniref:olfactory receptor 1-like n=1 Tax=Gopherus evgoodei TaxID=1825980 RepID=UPI0011D02BD5|nr:olfactory receptor 1-like [Gopherus evgoodei]
MTTLRSTEWHSLQVSLFILFLAMYLLSFTGNITIIITLRMDSRLHTPMYLFLGNLSFLDMGYTSTTVLMLLSILLTEMKTIPLAGCLLQSYVFFFLGTAECFLFAAMAYDRYVAICYPLRYSTIMSKRVCMLLIIGSWIVGCLTPLVAAFLVISLPFCGAKVVNHFTSHLTVVSLYYGTVIFMYMSPTAQSSFNMNKIVAVVYSVINPILNQMIYSLRNQDMKILRKIFFKR